MSIPWPPSAAETLPADGFDGTLAGRVWLPDVGGPAVVAVREDGLVDVTATFATMRSLAETDDPAGALRSCTGPVVGTVEGLLANTPPETRDPSKPWLLSPIDLQVVKAAGVTFPLSMLERVIEERARGDLGLAAGIRAEITATIGGSLDTLRPGSMQAAALKEMLIEREWWSQYLEVGIGPDAEVFTKAPVLSTVGTAVDVGVYRGSHWNNPEPEIVLVVASDGRIVGACLGNDVNLRDIEGRSALLLGKAKDNNASAAVGPFIRLFDSGFGLDELRTSVVSLTIDGEDDYHLEGTSELAQISRDPVDIVGQVIGAHHQYPDGFVLYLGTMFAPVDDRDERGRGFTHKSGDVVRISEARLGSLVNRVRSADEAEPWTFGVDALYRNLAARGLLD
ncbi:fumarylacetoacetate hydrolase family protein [Diaminobutyricibacter sp. McL0618]|uniref:fumarylacetoacetate hydrolase family protein n=1 Tax=Leifsonia sp. McL0618 TaxID=3415677 RepID=UPI003CEF6D08